ncbi:unannotated protein [freshwater metagenome]|uniref:Unannotated protein n=1 Tax=freshwater metagenome TaxID=449393 RepID=A0A6J7I955_9ZZZZ|nr:hypothetical protein [Actinomycetota bacterium]
MYRRRASPLHAARAGVTALYGLALVALALSFTHPVVLAAVAVATLLAGHLAGVGPDLLRAGRFSFVLAGTLAIVNALVVREGLTVLWRFGELPPLGQVDVTLEALVYGLLLGMRVVVIVLAFALLTACVDPDAVLRAFGRRSLRSALTATLATRMVPVLARDARRMDEALRCRPDAAGMGTTRGRAAVVRAVASGALDRAVDVAATLELRGYAARPSGVRGAREPWSRHDLSVLAAAVALCLIAVVTAITGAADLDAYPRLHAADGLGALVIGVLIVLVALLPFCDRRGTEL